MSEVNELKCIEECGDKFKFLKKLRDLVLKNHTFLKIDEIASTSRDRNKDLYVIFTCELCSKSYIAMKKIKQFIA